MVIKDKIERVKVTDLYTFPDNPRKHSDEQIKFLSNQIEDVGFNQPLIIDDKNQVLVGNGRLLAADKLSLLELPAIRYTDKYLQELADKKQTTIDQIKKQIVIADNKLNDLSDWNTETLNYWLNQLNESDLETYFTAEEQTEIFDEYNETEATEDNFEEPKKAKYKIHKGDKFLLGNHKLVCGDATNKQDIDNLMNGEKADMVFTDPPYNVNIGWNTFEGKNANRFKDRTIKNDSMTREQFIQFTNGYLRAYLENSNGPYYIFMSCKEWGTIMNAFEELGGHWSSTIIWNKSTFVLSRKDYHPKFEPILYGWKEGEKIKHLDDRSQNDVWDFDKSSKSELHPTMKPIELCSRAINNSSKQKDIVLDLFGGSGSTLIACEQLNRKCYMMELDEHYCSVIIERWETLTGKKATKSDLSEIELNPENITSQ